MQSAADAGHDLSERGRLRLGMVDTPDDSERGICLAVLSRLGVDVRYGLLWTPRHGDVSSKL